LRMSHGFLTSEKMTLGFRKKARPWEAGTSGFASKKTTPSGPAGASRVGAI
jgi:hypothetical protein